MSKTTPIEWCDSTVNPTSGCDGCELYNPKDPFVKQLGARENLRNE